MVLRTCKLYWKMHEVTFTNAYTWITPSCSAWCPVTFTGTKDDDSLWNCTNKLLWNVQLVFFGRVASLHGTRRLLEEYEVYTVFTYCGLRQQRGYLWRQWPDRPCSGRVMIPNDWMDTNMEDWRRSGPWFFINRYTICYTAQLSAW